MKLLIADDQPSVHVYLEKVIDWNLIGFDEIIHAYSGEECLESVLSQKPALVLLDICIPEKTGIEILNYLHDQGYHNSRFIVISAYDRFSYAQQAFRYGVDDYLLKPIDRSELAHIVHESIKKIYRNASDSLRRFIMHDHDSWSYFDVFQLSNESVRGAIISYAQGTDNDGYIWADDRYLTFTVSSKCQFVLMKGNADIHELLEAFPADSKISLGTTVCLQQHCDIKTAFQAALAMQTRRLFWKIDGDIPDISEQKMLDVIKMARLGFVQTLRAMKTPDYIQLRDISCIMMKQISTVVPYVDQVVLLCTDIMKEASSINPMFSAVVSSNDIEVSLRQCSDKDTLVQSMVDALIHSCTDKGNKEDTGETDINSVCQYLSTHLSEDISLDVIAKEFFINKYDLCRKFKQQTSQSLWNYFTALRMEKAKKLLIETDCKIYDIAQYCGFNSTTHFSNTFLKSTGMRPQSWRDQYQ